MVDRDPCASKLGLEPNVEQDARAAHELPRYLAGFSRFVSEPDVDRRLQSHNTKGIYKAQQNV
jgi:hypothetical protein